MREAAYGPYPARDFGTIGTPSKLLTKTGISFVRKAPIGIERCSLEIHETGIVEAQKVEAGVAAGIVAGIAAMTTRPDLL